MDKGETITLEPHQILFEEGAEWDGLYFIRHGEIEIYREANDKIIQLNRLKEGDFIGIATMVNRNPRLASARATSNCQLLRFSKIQTVAMLKSLPKWGKAVIKEMIRTLDLADKQIVEANIRPGGKIANPKYLPVYELLVFLNGLCWNEYLPSWETADRVDKILPVNDLGDWLEPSMQIPAEKIDEALQVLREYQIVQLDECGRYKTCIMNPDRVLFQGVAQRMKDGTDISVTQARSILDSMSKLGGEVDDRLLSKGKQMDALATVLKNLSLKRYFEWDEV